MTNFPYQSALITGASSGIGKAFAHELAQKGLNLILTARSEKELAKISDDLQTKYNIHAKYIVADLSDINAAEKIYNQLNQMDIKIDLLINNAGIGKWNNFLDESMETYEQLLQLNINSLVKLCHLFIPKMLQTNNGGIINIASTGALQPCPYIAVYCASKAFVLNFSESLYGEYSDRGITVTAICPGNTQTNFQVVAKANTSGMNYDSPEKVAHESINALLARKNTKIIGYGNQLQALLPRILPRRLIIKIVKNMMDKKVNSKSV